MQLFTKAARYDLGVSTYPFLSPEWTEAARSLRDEYAGEMDAPPVETRINVIVTEVPHGENDTIEGHIDTSTGQTIIDHDHIADPELTVTVDYATAKAAFVSRDPQAVMEALFKGQILVEGDASKLLALQPMPINPDEEQLELLAKLDALTDKDK